MGVARRALLAIVVGLLLALVGCTADVPPEESASPAPRPAISLPGSESVVGSGPGASAGEALVGTGIALAGAPPNQNRGSGAPGQMVADGAGQLWLLGAWQVTRVDPATGKSSSWDASDDAAFAQAGYGTGEGPGAILVESSGPGVWLVSRDRARLFDGKRFVRDLRVPPDLMADAGSRYVSFVADLVEVGSAVWMSVQTLSDDGSAGRVVRWSGGAWTAMSRDEEGIGGYLAVDTDGGVWAGGRWDTGVYSGSTPSVRRWDGSAWTRPSDGQAAAPKVWGDVVADPTGGVWVLTQRGEAEVTGEDGEMRAGAATLHRFDGSSWRSVPPILTGWWAPDEYSDRRAWLDVTQAGQAWVVSGDCDQSGVTSISPQGVVAQSSPQRTEPGECWVGSALAVVDDAAFGMDSAGVVNVAAPGPTRVWEGDTSAVANQSGLLTALSADEAVVFKPAERGNLLRYRDGTWVPFGPDVDMSEDVSDPAYAFATDGALWLLSNEGTLTRTARKNVESVATDVWSASILPGRKGSVWLRSANGAKGPIVGYGADGAKVAIASPDGDAYICAMAAGRDGSVWAGAAQMVREDGGFEDYPCDEVRDLARWDGSRWKHVDLPHGQSSVTNVVVSDDGAGWVVFPDASIGRYLSGRWKVFQTNDPIVYGFSAAPGGRVCAGEVAGSTRAIVCYGSAGEVARFDLSGMGVSPSGGMDFSIAPDGAVWVLGPQVARLGQALPTR